MEWLIVFILVLPQSDNQLLPTAMLSSLHAFCLSVCKGENSRARWPFDCVNRSRQCHINILTVLLAWYDLRKRWLHVETQPCWRHLVEQYKWKLQKWCSRKTCGQNIKCVSMTSKGMTGKDTGPTCTSLRSLQTIIGPPPENSAVIWSETLKKCIQCRSLHWGLSPWLSFIQQCFDKKYSVFYMKIRLTT